MMKLLQTIFMLCIGFVCGQAMAAPQPVVVLPVVGAIGPASADFVIRNIARAEQEQAQLLVLQMDTPGGLDSAIRQIIKAILASRVPVVTFVSPSGARAASAGTYILYASHIAAMAPGTNLGAATPVEIGAAPALPPSGQPGHTDGRADGQFANKSVDSSENTMRRKEVHDAAAYIRGLAQLRRRNADWAERAVREAVSLSADEALKQKVVDVVARDVPQLLAQLDGFRVTTVEREWRLATAHAPVMTIEPDWKARLLAIITDPSMALILMMIGIYGLIFEFASPGMVLPGVLGSICLLLGLYALQMLPVNYAGLALLALGMAFMVTEAFIASFGVLGIAGMAAFALGAMLLIDTDVPGFGIPIGLIIGLSLLTGACLFLIVGLMLRARRRPVVSGREQLPGSSGVMLVDSVKEGWAQVHGERWRIQSAMPLKRGQHVRVVARHGLVLSVVPQENETGA